MDVFRCTSGTKHSSTLSGMHPVTTRKCLAQMFPSLMTSMVMATTMSSHSKATGAMAPQLVDCLCSKDPRMGFRCRTTLLQTRQVRSLDVRYQAEGTSMEMVTVTLSFQIQELKTRQLAILPSRSFTGQLMDSHQVLTRASNAWRLGNCLEPLSKSSMTSTTMEWMNCSSKNSLLLELHCTAVQFTCSWATHLRTSPKHLIGPVKARATSASAGCLLLLAT